MNEIAVVVNDDEELARELSNLGLTPTPLPQGKEFEVDAPDGKTYKFTCNHR